MPHAARTISTVALALLALLCTTTVCPAQGTSGVFPEPMDWQAFQKLAQPLALSNDQLEAMEPVHEQYLREMMALRDGTIAEFIEEEGSLHLPGPGLDVEQAEARADDFRSIHRRLATIERSFFDGIAPGLGPGQLERLQVARDWRHRQRLLESSWPWNRFTPSMDRIQLELRPLVPWDRIDAESASAVEQDLATWEQQRTRLAQQLFEQRLKGWSREKELEQELGPIRMGDMEADPEESWQQYRDEQLRRHREAYEGALKTTNKLRSHTRSGVRTISSHLPERVSRDLTWAYWKKAYGRSGGMDFRRILSNTIEAPPADDVDVAALESLLAEHDAGIRPHMDEIARLIEEDDDTRGATFFYSVEETEESPLGVAHSEMRKRNITTARRFQGILGGHTPDGISRWLAMLDERGDPGSTTPSAEAEMSVAISIGTDEGLFDEDEAVLMGTTVGEMNEMMEMFGSAPDPLSDDELDMLVADLRIDQDGREVVDVLFETYLRDAEELRSDFRTSQQQSMMRMATDAERGGGMTADPETIMDFDRQMKQLVEDAQIGMKQLDDQLFDDLVLAIERAEDQVILDWYRMSRERERTGGGSMMSNVMVRMEGGMNQGWTVNVFKLVAGIELEPDERRRVLDALAGWHRPATELVQRNAALDDRVAGFMNQMIVAQSVGFDDEGMEKIRDVVEEMTAVQEEQEQVKQELLERNRAGVGAMIDVMSNENGIRLRNAFRMASFPAVYEDPHAMTDALLAASRLDELDDQARGAIYELQQEYDARYGTYCGQIVEIFERMPPLRTAGFSMEHIEEREADRREADRIRFERDDYSDKTRDKLRNLLTAEQVTAIGGLKPATRTTVQWPQF